jgi:PTH1 family peptidyl-tRNA hydrolase
VLEPGDLVILKGSDKADKLERIALQWQPRGTAVAATVPLSAAPQRPREVARLVVGLGNPAPRFAASPHNVGYRTVEQTAARMGASWVCDNGHLAATASIAGTEVRFLKVGTSMNDVGEGLARYVSELGLGPTECIVIHDDVDLPPGVVRWRARGSAGGHRGLASILVAMQSDEIPRLKIGVGRPERGTVSEFVLAPMEGDRAAAVGAALDQSVDLLTQILTSATPVKDCSITVKPAGQRP